MHRSEARAIKFTKGVASLPRSIERRDPPNNAQQTGEHWQMLQCSKISSIGDSRQFTARLNHASHITWFCSSQATQPPSSQRLAWSAIFALYRRCCAHQAFQTEIPPSRLLHLLRRSLDAERSMLIGHDIVFVVGVYRLVLWWDIDLFSRKLKAREVLEQVGVMRLVKMEIGEGRIA